MISSHLDFSGVPTVSTITSLTSLEDISWDMKSVLTMLHFDFEGGDDAFSKTNSRTLADSTGAGF